MKGQLGQFEEIFEFFAVIQNDGSPYLEEEDGEVIVFKPDTSKPSGCAAANDSQIQAGERQVLLQLFGVTYLGDFWMDALGNLGYVGGPAIANIL